MVKYVEVCKSTVKPFNFTEGFQIRYCSCCGLRVGLLELANKYREGAKKSDFFLLALFWNDCCGISVILPKLGSQYPLRMPDLI